MRSDPHSEILLAMDTTGDVCGVAALRDGQLVAERTFRHGMHLSERLIEQVDGVLRDAETTLDAVAAFAVGIGPGSFTGVRIGVMTLKTFAAVLDRPIYGVGDLEALAYAYTGLTVPVAPLLPCRTGVVYAAAYSVAAEAPSPFFDPDAFSLTDLGAKLAVLEAKEILFCGLAASRYREELRAATPPGIQISFGGAVYPRAADVGALACLRRKTGEVGEDPILLTPLYLSPPPITMPRKPILQGP